jgi:hypothetical protein
MRSHTGRIKGASTDQLNTKQILKSREAYVSAGKKMRKMLKTTEVCVVCAVGCYGVCGVMLDQ